MTWQVGELPDPRALKWKSQGESVGGLLRKTLRWKVAGIHCLATVKAEEMERPKSQEMVKILAECGGEDAYTGSANEYGTAPSSSADQGGRNWTQDRAVQRLHDCQGQENASQWIGAANEAGEGCWGKRDYEGGG